MAAKETQAEKYDKLQRKVDSIAQSMREVLNPALEDISNDIKEIKGEGYLSKVEAKSEYVSIATFNALKDRYERAIKYTVTIILMLIGGIITLAYQVLGRGV